MLIKMRCKCGMNLKIREEFAGKRGICPYCGRETVIPSVEQAEEAEPQPGPDAAQASSQADQEAPLDVVEFLDPPSKPIAPKEKTHWFRKMMVALLDPRAIQWLLVIGGALMVLGMIIWLVSLGVFENPYYLAVALGLASLSIHGGGCFVVLKTRFKTAGRALTFLGCVVLPLNVWFYYANDMMTLEGHLWVGVFVCCLIYGATVFVLRDPLFMYAVEGGLTLTLLLLLAAFGGGSLDWASAVSLALIALALVSIHAKRAFPPEGETFTRLRFGMPLFWSGHLQLAGALVFLAAAQGMNLFLHPSEAILGIRWHEISVGNAEMWLLAGGLWLAGAYAYAYSDFVVRRKGIFTYVAAISLIMAELTIVGVNIRPELLIVVIAVTGAAVCALRAIMAGQNERLSRGLPPLAMILSSLAVIIGVVVHVRATSDLIAKWNWDLANPTGWPFVGAMLLAAIANRGSAFVERKHSLRYSAVYFFLSAASVIVAAAGLLRRFDLTQWHEQAPLLMLIPLAYLIASHMWRGKPAAWPLGWVAHAAAAVILLHAMGGSVNVVEEMLKPVTGELANLLLGVVFVEATIFYSLAAFLRRKSANVYLAGLAACAAVWEFVGYFDVDEGYYTLIYAGFGIGLVVVSRVLGVKEGNVYRESGLKLLRLDGRGTALYQYGTAILVMAFLAAFLQGLARLASQRGGWSELLPLFLTTLAGGLAICLAARRAERWLHTASTVALAGLCFLMLNFLVPLHPWEKVEIFCAAVGVLMLVAGYIGRFREETPSDAVSVGLWLGSILAAGSLFIAVIFYRSTTGPSTGNEFGLLTISILMLASGCALQFKAPALLGGSTLSLYLATVIVQLAYHSAAPTGVYLAVGGAALFGLGLALSMYRERLLLLPEKFANREGLFKVIGWR